MKKLLRENWILLVLGIFLMASMLLAIRNNYTIERNHEVQQQAELVRQRTEEILSRTMHGLDLGIRGFGLVKDESMLRPYEEAIATTGVTLRQLDSLLQLQGYNGGAQLEEMKREIQHYIEFGKEMVATARRDDMAGFTRMLKEDKGYDVWKKYSAFSQPLFAYEDDLNRQAIANYSRAIRNNLLLQGSILVLLLPLLYIFLMRIRKERDARQALLLEVERNDQQFVFNPGAGDGGSAEVVNDTSIRNVHKASSFIQGLATGDYNVHWEGLNDDNAALNKTTLAGNLMHLREQLRKVKEEDEKRNWINQGVAEFSDLVRTHQDDMKILADRSVAYLTKYLGAQQGGLFIRESQQGDEHLNLAGCYAFNKKKWIDKRVEIGQGLIGQAFLEGETMQLKQVPEGYTSITSGLGDATPRHLVIVPFKHDRQTVALMEMASFTVFSDHQVSFLEKAGDFLASSIVNSQNTQKMKQLLQEASVNEEQTRQREEEMRQNMEELQATQEELVRKEREMQRRLSGVLQ